MRPVAIVALSIASLLRPGIAIGQEVQLRSPGTAASTVDRSGRLLEDWGRFEILVDGAPLAGPTVSATRLDGVVPAAKVESTGERLAVSMVAFRAPAHPAGLDVVTVTLTNRASSPVTTTISLRMPDNAIAGSQSTNLAGRTIITLPEPVQQDASSLREWGYADEGSSLPGWGSTQVPCDPAFRNIRAGMGGVPLVYNFPIERRGAATVVLGLMESYWTEAGHRPLVCRVEGAPPQEVDPIQRWGKDKPGGLQFAARDVNGDGRLDIVVSPGSGATDRNPILNAIWIFAPDAAPAISTVITGRANGLASRYVDCGGTNDQSIYPPGKVEYSVALAGNSSRELTFLVACPGATAPQPNKSAWTLRALRKAARDVWTNWKETTN